MRRICAVAGAAMALLAPTVAMADSIASVEGARARERQGVYLTRQDREQLRRYGSNDDYRYRYGPSYGYDPYGYGGYEGGYGYGPSVGLYFGY